MAKKNNRNTKQTHLQKTYQFAEEEKQKLEKKRLARLENKEKKLAVTQATSDKGSKEQNGNKVTIKQIGKENDIFAALDGCLNKLPDREKNFKAPEPVNIDEDMENKILPDKPRTIIHSLFDQKKRMSKLRQVQKNDEKKRVKKKFLAKKKLEEEMENMLDGEDSEEAEKKFNDNDDENENSEDLITVRPTETRRDIKVRKRIEKRERKGLKYVNNSTGKKKEKLSVRDKRMKKAKTNKKKLNKASVIKKGDK
ncbi:unnamed protein product [Amoebophrya sp. A120]|nr:unnamed protein product [Amoebophrya sp. A120]|eukprot:GSA120T00013869001.1